MVDAGVVGVPDEEAGELPRAFVVKQEGSAVTEDEIATFVSGTVIGFLQSINKHY